METHRSQLSFYAFLSFLRDVHITFSGRVPSRSQVETSPEAEVEEVRDLVDPHVDVN